MNTFDLLRRDANRRTFLSRSLTGLGAFALSSMLPKLNAAPKFASKGVVQPLHFEPKVKRVIFLTMAGGPSHLETLDYKPKLAAMDGKPMPDSFTNGQQIAQLQGKKLICFGPQHEFETFGKSGQHICKLFPHI